MSPQHTPDRATRRDPRLVALAEESGYEVHERIGAGGMGIVYRAHDADGNEVAIKLLRHDVADDPRSRARLAREVSAQRLVHNDNIVRILDAELDSPDAFVVTEFVPGPTLDDAVRDLGGLHPEAVREIGLVMSESLTAIHTAGVVHRDLKPSNVLLRGSDESDLVGFDPDGDRLDPVIIDFGIAVAAEESRLTSTGLVMGTAAYLDPEVMRTNRTDEATDWWALAALMAFTATGREPYGSGRADLVLLRAERGEIDLEGVPTELGKWLGGALRPDPAARPPPDEMRASLAELDLSYFDDPGETEALDARGRTIAHGAGAAAAGAGGAAAGAAGAAAGAGAAGAGEDTDALDPTQALPSAADPDDPTQALSPVSDDPDPTQALSPTPGPDGEAAGPDGGREPATQELSAVGGDDEDPDDSWHADDPTEMIPTVRDATRPLPVVRDSPSPQSPGRNTAGNPYAGGGPVRRQAPVRGVTPTDPAFAGAAQPPQTAPAQTAPPQHQYAQQVQPYQQQVPVQQGYPNPAGYPAWQDPPPPRRSLLVWLGHLILIALAAVAPYMALAMLLLLGALARTWEQSHRAVVGARARGKGSGGTKFGVGTAAPLRFVVGILVTALQAVFPLILGLLIGLAADAAATLLMEQPLPDSIVFVIAFVVTLLLTWVGIGGRTTRTGAHRVLDAAAPDGVWTAVVGGLLCLLLAAVVSVALTRGGDVDYTPFLQGPRLSDLALWRR